MPRIYMTPNPKGFARAKAKNRPSSGIQRVVEEISPRLKKMGWEFTDDAQAADISAAHACSNVGADVLHAHGLYPTGEIDNAPAWMWEVNSRVLEGIRAAETATVPSRWVADLFLRDMGFQPEILRHGIDVDSMQDPLHPSKRSQTVLWNKNRPVDVCSPQPVNELSQKMTRTQFITTFGDSRPNVQVTGTMPHKKMMDMLRRAGVYLSTTRETYGIGVLEALAFGIPVVTWNWGHVPELIEHRETGYIVEPYDYEATERAIRECLNHVDRMAPKARESARQYDWDSVAKKYDALYRRVLKRKNATNPLVSIIIPLYNYEDYIGEAVQSVKDQTYDNWECLILNDGSSDNSFGAAIEAAQGDDRFTVVNQNNLGVSKTRNRGAKLAEGKYIAFLDADDRLKPNFIDLLLPPLEENRALALTFGKLEVFKHGGDVRVGPWPDGFDFSKQLRRENQVPATNLMRREAFLRTGGFRQRYAPAEDAALWTYMGMIGNKMAMVTREPTYEYRLHDQSASAGVRGSKEDEPNWTRPRAPGFASIGPSTNASHPVYNYDKPLVSFVIPVGDGHEDILLEAIDSVVVQSRPEWELIVVDDTTEGNLANYGIIPYKEKFPFANFVRSDGGNVGRARNMGAIEAKGKYLCFLDADDILHEEFLMGTLALAGDGMVYTDFLELPEKKPHQVEDFSLDLLRRRAIFPITFLHPRRAWQEVGGFDEDLVGWEDWDYALNLALHGYCGVHVHKPLVGYRYDTGKRREDSLKQKDTLLKRIHEKWDTEKPEPCKPCEGEGGPTLRRQRTQADDNFARLAEVEFLPNQRGARLYRTPNGSTYRFGSDRHKTKLVRTEDLGFFKGRKEFRVREAQEVKRIRNLQLPGVPDDLLNVLAERGWTRESLARAFVSDLTSAGLSEAAAEKVIDIAQDTEETAPKSETRVPKKRHCGG